MPAEKKFCPLFVATGAELHCDVLAAETPAPGTLRKVGPSLRHLAGKLDAAFVESFLLQPADFRPDSRMPALFGHYGHLEGKTLDDTRRLEAVEARRSPNSCSAGANRRRRGRAGWVHQPPPSAGKRRFATCGCLACHKHAEFPEVQSTIGPDLSRLSAKLTTEAGKKWLTAWLRDPVRYSPRTAMPGVPLEPISRNAAEGSRGRLRPVRLQSPQHAS